MSKELIKIVIVILVASVLITALRNRLGEYSFILILTVIAVVMVTLLDNLYGAINTLNDLFKSSGNAGVYFATPLKALGISYITNVAADTCRDYGMSSLAQTAEIGGKIAIFVLSLPLMTTLLDTALKFIGL